MSKGILWAVILKPLSVSRRYPNGEPHHITLHYGVERSQFSWLEGQEFKAVIWAESWNERVQALRVQVPGVITRSILHPHITVSWVDGAEPNESNAMLAQVHQCHLYIPNQHTLCRIEFHEWSEEQTTAEGEA